MRSAGGIEVGSGWRAYVSIPLTIMTHWEAKGRAARLTGKHPPHAKDAYCVCNGAPKRTKVRGEANESGSPTPAVRWLTRIGFSCCGQQPAFPGHLLRELRVVHSLLKSCVVRFHLAQIGVKRRAVAQIEGDCTEIIIPEGANAIFSESILGRLRCSVQPVLGRRKRRRAVR